VAALVDAQGEGVTPLIEPSPAIIASWPETTLDVRNAAPLAAPTLHLTDAQGDVRPLEDIEREVIRFAIAHYRNQMSEVARKLKIGRSTLYRKLEGLGLDESGTPQSLKQDVPAA